MPAPLTAEQKAADRERLLDSAETLLYAEGIGSVGMDRVRDAAGLSLKRIYSMFGTKDALVVAVLQRRDTVWRGSLADAVAQVATPTARVAAMFAWLEDWFGSDDFRGCAWINANAELGATSTAVAAEVRAHKAAFREQIRTMRAQRPQLQTA